MITNENEFINPDTIQGESKLDKIGAMLKSLAEIVRILCDIAAPLAKTYNDVRNTIQSKNADHRPYTV